MNRFAGPLERPDGSGGARPEDILELEPRAFAAVTGKERS
jgi:hypothetical protein